MRINVDIDFCPSCGVLFNPDRVLKAETKEYLIYYTGVCPCCKHSINKRGEL